MHCTQPNLKHDLSSSKSSKKQVQLLLAVILFASFATGVSAQPSINADTSVTVTGLERVVIDSDLPPTADLLKSTGISWQPSTLPIIEDPAHYDSMNEFTVSWFRVPVADISPQQWQKPALYVSRHNVRIGVYYEGRYLGGTLQHKDPEKLSISWNQPVLFDLPITGLKSNHPYLYLRVDAGPGGTVLSPLVFDERLILQQRFNERNFLQVEASFWVFVMCCVLCVLSLWLWSRRRQDRLYLEFSLLSALSAITTSFYYLDFVPFDMRTWLTIQHSASAWVLMFIVRFATSALDLNWRIVNRSLALLCLAATLSYLVLPAYYLQPTAYSVSGFLGLVGLFLGGQVIYTTIRKPTGTRVWFSIAFLGLFALQLHDINAVFFSTDAGHIEASNWMQFSSPMLAIAFFAHLIHRFTDALEVSENLNRDLEARVAATKLELQNSYEKNRAFELESHANEERQRIYRELHDDLGSKLISIVHTAEDTPQQSLARGALESLRESIYKASNPSQTLEQCVEQITEEAELRLTSAGKGFSAQISFSEDNMANADINPNSAYNLKRIFREAVSNILQHARCQNVILILNQTANQIELQLEDDGVGQVQQVGQSGGLANIAFRAERMGASVKWQNLTKNDRQGNRLELCFAFPLESSVLPAS